MIKEVIVVEGKNDIAAIRRAVDAECIATGGYGLASLTLKKIDQAEQKRGIIILTDPDSPGERIRKFLAARYPEAKHAFVPKAQALRNGDVGIEQASPEDIRSALNKVRLHEWRFQEEFTIADMIHFELTGGSHAADRRAQLGQSLGIGYTNAKQFLYRLNHYGVTREEFETAVGALEEHHDTSHDC